MRIFINRAGFNSNACVCIIMKDQFDLFESSDENYQFQFTFNSSPINKSAHVSGYLSFL